MQKSMKAFFIATLMMSILGVSVFNFSMTSNAASKNLPAFSTNKYLKCYTLKNSGKIWAYTSSDLKTLKSGYWIDCATDECYIVSISGNAVKVSYPLNQGGRTSQWFNAKEFSSALNTAAKTAKTKAEIPTYKRSDGKASYGHTGSGDEIYILTTAGAYTQVIYELTNGMYKLGWIKTSDGDKYLSSSSSSDTAEEDSIRTKMDKIINGSLSYNNNTVMQAGKIFTGYRSGEQCKGYAKNVFEMLWGKVLGSTIATSADRYQLTTVSGISCIKSLTSASEDSVKNFYLSAKAGDAIQMQSKTAAYYNGKKYYPAHSAIVYSVDDTGVYLLEANVAGTYNYIRFAHRTWRQISGEYGKMSIYRAK